VGSVSKEEQLAIGEAASLEMPAVETPDGHHQTVAEAAHETAPEEVKE